MQSKILNKPRSDEVQLGVKKIDDGNSNSHENGCSTISAKMLGSLGASDSSNSELENIKFTIFFL